MRVLLLNNVPAPYFTPLFDRLGRTADWELTVCYTSVWNQDVGWAEAAQSQTASHKTIILDQRWPTLRQRLGSSWAAALALLGVLRQQRPDYVLCYGYTLKPQFVLLLWAMLTATPFAVAGDANYYTDTAQGWKRTLKRWWLRQITRRAAALPFVGTANRLFWESYDARPEQLCEARFAVDNDFFAATSAAEQAASQTLRAEWNLIGKTVFLFVGRLVKRKNVDLLIRAVRQTPDEDFALVIAGSGEERAALEALADNEKRIIFAGHVAPNDLPRYYALADVLVLPAKQEPWGLVINEAMACGLAVIAHKHCGAAVDLVADDNGVLLNEFTATELATALQQLSRDRERQNARKRRSREKIQAWSLEAAARGLVRAIEHSATTRPAAPVDSVWQKER